MATRLQAKRLLEILAHGAPLLRVNAVELDRRPALARRYEVQAYNTAVIETEGREVKVERTTDLAQIALAALRALRQQTPTVCFVTGHGEFTGGPGPTPPHYTHQETLDAHQGYATEDRLMVAPAGLDRLYLALEAQGYEVREIALATLEAVPDDCAALVDLGPRHAYAANEADLLHRYLGRGGGLLLGYDPEFVPGPGTAALLAGLGVETADGQGDRSARPLRHRSGIRRRALLQPPSDHRRHRAHLLPRRPATLHRHAADQHRPVPPVRQQQGQQGPAAARIAV